MSMRRALRFLLSLVIAIFFATGLSAQKQQRVHSAGAKKVSGTVRELSWDAYVDKVEGAWMGKMIGVTFGQPWEFNYLGTPIGFDITDWPLSSTRMKDYRA